MAANIIDGKEIARAIRSHIPDEVRELKRAGVDPGLAVVLVGEDPGSQIYVRNKHLACQELGIYSEVHRLPARTGQGELLDLVESLNHDPKINGILVQLPLPEHIEAGAVIRAIDPDKDVDGLGPLNLGRLIIGEECFFPCTPAGIMVMLDHTGIDPEGKRAVVVGRSNMVGKPVAMMLLQRNATVTMCHTRTRDLTAECLNAEILVVAAGRPGVINGDMIKPGAVVIDVGTSRLEDGKLRGDVDFESAARKAAWISPVPGGVGPMTITMLMKNTVKAARRQWSRVS